MKNISSTLNLIHCKNKNEKIENILKKNNINKCIQWCERNNISHNKSNISTNIFSELKYFFILYNEFTKIYETLLFLIKLFCSFSCLQ